MNVLHQRDRNKLTDLSIPTRSCETYNLVVDSKVLANTARVARGFGIQIELTVGREYRI